VLGGYKKNFILIIMLLIVSPVFGVYLADLVGYHEPLDVAAEELKLHDITEYINWTPLIDYTFPGLVDWAGYIVSGFIGVGVIMLIGYILKKLVGGR